MENMIECASCGAAYPASKVRCPYCGTADDLAAEKEYMEQLKEVKNEMEAHTEDGEKAVSKGIGKTVGVFLIVILLFVLTGIYKILT